MSPARRRILVTAGPTREAIDPVRYLSNESSGRMGFAIARAAVARGFAVTLVAGPVALETPKGVQRVDVESARDMLKAVRAAFEDPEALFMAAAVADWRPARKLAGKWRKKDEGGQRATLELVKNPDVLATVAKRKGERQRCLPSRAMNRPSNKRSASCWRLRSWFRRALKTASRGCLSSI